MATPLLGFIRKKDRTKAQEQAHDTALTKFVKFALPCPQLTKGQKVALYDAWKDPVVVSEMGLQFERIHQLTGSCVWAGGTNAVVSTIAMQRIAGQHKTRAFLPFTLHNYACSRHYMGDDSQGEGSMGSTFAKSLVEDGIRDWINADGLPTYTTPDGLEVTEQIEMQWSSYRNPAIAKVVSESRAHTFGSAAECKSVEDIRAMILNGYGVTFACDRYIGNGRIVGSGDTAYVTGLWDGNGGHQQSIHAVWDHPNDGPLYWAQNNWPSSTYPKDPAGGPTCGVWVTEANVTRALRYDAEVYGLSHLNWFPAAPDVIDWATI